MRNFRPFFNSAGFTLLEIMLVIVIISVVTALVAPSMFRNDSNGVADETRRLQQVMRLAVDEAQLTGTPLRWWARAHSYGFERLTEQQWQQAAEGLFSTRKLSGVAISRVVENGLDQQLEEDDIGVLHQSEQVFFDREQKSDEPLIGRVLILPNGMVTMVDVELLANKGRLHRLLVRPGPAGIVEQHNGGSNAG
ncbi:MAG: type II secretion system protein [Mariprofundales bacterium]